MAKKERLTTSKSRMDDDLNFDFDDVTDDVKAKVNPAVRSKKRQAVLDSFKGVVEGVPSYMADSSVIRNNLQKALPASYGEVFSATDEVSSTISQLYDQASRELKPQAQRLGVKIDRLVPDSAKRIKAITTKLKSLLGAEAEKVSVADIESQGINTAIAQIFGEQAVLTAEQRKRDEVKDHFNEVLNARRHRSTLELLGSIDRSIRRQSQYTEVVNQAWQKKSLELQYRSYFVQQRQLETMTKFFEIFKTQNDSVVKNTGLPEYAKVTDMERAKAQTKERLIAGVHSMATKSLFGEDSAVQRMLQGVKKDAAEWIDGVKESMGALDFGVDMVQDAKEQIKDTAETMKEFAAMEAELGLPSKSGAYLAGRAASGMVSQFVLNRFTPRMRAWLERNQRFTDKGHELSSMIRNPYPTLNKKLTERESQNDGKPTVVNKLARYFLNKTMQPGLDQNLGSREGIERSAEGGAFDNKTQRSIVEVIPGYLSRILREVRVANTGDQKTDLIHYDFRTGRFSSTDRVKESIRQTYLDKAAQTQVHYRANALHSGMFGKNLSDEGVDPELKNFIYSLALETNFTHDEEGIRSTKAYQDLDKSHQEAVDSALAGFIEKKSSRAEGLNILSKRLSELRAVYPELRGEIQAQIALGYGTILEDMGVVEPLSNGSYSINYKRYNELIASQNGLNAIKKKKQTLAEKLKEAVAGMSDEEREKAKQAEEDQKLSAASIKKGGPAEMFLKHLNKGDLRPIETPYPIDSARMSKPDGTDTKDDSTGELSGSDMGLKTNISEYSPGKSLAALMKTKMFNWRYKSGKDLPEGDAVGPMAQHVRANFGDDAAPDGKKLDFLNLNGHTMSAVQALAQRQDKLDGSAEGPGAQGLLEDIREQITRLRELVELGAGISGGAAGGSGKRYYDASLSGFLTMGAGLARDATGRAAQAAGQAGKFSWNSIIAPGARGLKDKLAQLKAPAAGALDWMRNEGIGMAGSGLTRLGQTGANLAGSSLEQLKNSAEWIKKNLLHYKDLYLPGGIEPVLTAAKLRAGEYYDSATGKAVRTIGELAKVSGNIVDSAGNTIVKGSELAQGLYDRHGEQVKSFAIRSMKAVARGMLLSAMQGTKLAGLMAGKAGDLGNWLKAQLDKMDISLGFGIGLGNKKTYEMLVEIRDILASTTPVRRRKAGKRGPGAATPAPQAEGAQPTIERGSFFNGLGGKLKSAYDSLKPQKVEPGSPAQKPGDKSKPADAQKKPAFNDQDGDGQRDGSWKQRLAAMRDKAKDGVQKIKLEVPEPKYFSGKALDGMMDTAKSLFSGASSLFDKIKGLKGAKDVLGKGGLLKKGLGIGKGLLKGGGSLVKGLGTIGKGALGLAGLLPGASTAAKALGLARGVATVAAATGTGALSILGAAGTAILGALSSPVVIGALAVAAIGYGAWKAYKYFNRNSVNEFEDIRMKQYGVNADEQTKAYNCKVLQLEAYFNDGRVGWRGEEPYIVGSKVNPKDLLELFDINEKDAEASQAFIAWLEQRFKPVFFYHHKALYKVNPKVSFDKIDSLKGEEKARYASLAGYDGGPYEELTSPFKTIAALPQTAALVKVAYENLSNKYKLTAKADEAKDIKKVPEQAVKPMLPEEIAGRVNAPPKSSDKPVIPVTTGEGDGKTTIAATQATKPSTSAQPLKLANGDIIRGASGMSYIQLGKGVSLDGMNSELLKNFLGMAEEYGSLTGKKIQVNSGARSSAQQEALWRANPQKAAPPGKSLHEFGLAMDINTTDADALEDLGLMRKYGFTRPIGQEGWHVEPAGIQVDLNRAKNDANFASQAVAASLFKGGGGAGTVSGIPQGKRDPQMALSLLGASAATIDAKKKTEQATAAVLPTRAVSPEQRAEQAGAVPLGAASASQKSQTFSPNMVGEGVESAKMGQAGASVPAPQANDPQGVRKYVEQVAKEAGVDPDMTSTFVAMESGFRPDAQSSSSSAKGLMQFTSGTWNEQMSKKGAAYKLDPSTPPTDVRASTILGIDYMKQNTKALQSVKPNVNAADLYLAHLLGPSGAKKLLAADQSALAADILPSAAKGNTDLFYSQGRALTVSEFMTSIGMRMNSKAKEFGIDYSVAVGNASTKQTGMSTQTPVSSSSLQEAVFPSSTPAASTPAPRARQAAPSMPETVLTPSAKTSGRQQANPLSLDQTNDWLEKSYKVQTDILSVLRKIAERNTEAPAVLAVPASTRTRTASKPEVLASPINLSRQPV